MDEQIKVDENPGGGNSGCFYIVFLVSVLGVLIFVFTQLMLTD